VCSGWPFFKRGWNSIVTRRLNMFTLIAIGVGTAYLFSAVVMLVPGAFPISFAPDGKVGIYSRWVEYPEACFGFASGERMRDGKSLRAQAAQRFGADVSYCVCGEISQSGDERGGGRVA
jgi:cation transport ATPase